MMEFHISRDARNRYQLADSLFSFSGNVIFANVAASRQFAYRMNLVRNVEKHPERAVNEAGRVLRPGGRIVILDLVKHRYEEARELYADEWLGFSEVELETMLEKAGFLNVQTSVVHKEPETPQFQTLLAVGNKQG